MPFLERDESTRRFEKWRGRQPDERGLGKRKELGKDGLPHDGLHRLPSKLMDLGLSSASISSVFHDEHEVLRCTIRKLTANLRAWPSAAERWVRWAMVQVRARKS